MPADALAELDVVISDVHRLCGDAASVLQWLAQHGLIRNLLRCGECDIAMSLQSRQGNAFVDGYCWACRRCRRQKSVTCDSFFAGSHLKLGQLVDCVYWWSCQMKLSDTCVEIGVLAKTLVDWHNFICDILISLP